MAWPAKKIPIREAIRRIYDHLRSERPHLSPYVDDEGHEVPEIQAIDRDDQKAGELAAHRKLCEGFSWGLRLWAVTPARKRGEDPDRSEVSSPPSKWPDYFQAIIMRTARYKAGKPPSATVVRLHRTELDQIFLDEVEFDAWPGLRDADDTPKAQEHRSPQQELVRPILELLYPHGVPPHSELTDGELIKAVQDKAKKGKLPPKRDTILRAAGRASTRRSGVRK